MGSLDASAVRDRRRSGRWRRRVVALAVAAAVAGSATACGTDSAPEYGPYSTQRIDDGYDTGSSRSRGVLAESLRLGEHLVFPGDVDAALTVGRGGGVIVDTRGVMNLLSMAQRDALDDFEVLGGYGAIAADRAAGAADQAERMLSISLLTFPDEQSAAAAAGAMARRDFAQAAVENAPLSIPGYPGALAHWRPGVPTVGSWLAVKSVVIRVYASVPEANPDQLVNVVAGTYQRQVPALEKFVSTLSDNLPDLPLDPGKLLPRLVGTADPVPDHDNFAVYGLHEYAVQSDHPLELRTALANRGVSSIALADNKILYRARDDAAARDLAGYLASAATTPAYTPISGVAGIDGIRCDQATEPNPNTLKPYRFRCFVTRGDGVAQVLSSQDTDARWLAAAQYAVMGDE